MGAARDFLKQSTVQAHRKLDEGPLVTGLSNGTLTPHAYQAMLGGYLDFFQPFEAAIRTQRPEIVRELGARRFEKSEWLAQDIALLGGTAPAAPVAGGGIPIPADDAALAGMLYVVEGSTLGGMHLSRSKRGLPGGVGRFFRGYGEETIPAWSEFIEWLESRIVSEKDRVSAAQAANRTFEWFQRRFTEIVHVRDPGH